MPTVRAVEVSDVAFECFVSRVRIEYINHRFRTIDNGYLNHTVFLTYQDAAKHACHDYVEEIERLEQLLETKKKKLAELMASIEKNEVPCQLGIDIIGTAWYKESATTSFCLDCKLFGF